MEKYIYKITNLINNKVYIGQTKDLHKRWKEHCGCASDRRYTNYLYNAMRKYGIDNFKMEIIEGPTSDYNEREKYWISYYNSFLDKNKGYNMTPGGEDPPILSGDKSSATIYNEETINQIQSALMDNKLSYDEISQKFEISKEYLSMINRGFSRKIIACPIHCEKMAMRGKNHHWYLALLTSCYIRLKVLSKYLVNIKSGRILFMT